MLCLTITELAENVIVCLRLCYADLCDTMKTNSNTRIIGKCTVLIPYKKGHVLKYHTWMQDEELQELTASEPLTLSEEYSMQKSWLEDNKKCTFIILDKELFLNTDDEIESMIGDVNLFFNDADNDKAAEIEVMIADSKHRGKGKGKEALLLMLRYGVENLSAKKFVAKIKTRNFISLQMFKSLCFVEISHSIVFQETVMEVIVDEKWKKDLLKRTSMYKVETDKG